MASDPAVGGVTLSPVMTLRLRAALDPALGTPMAPALGKTAGASMVAACTTSERPLSSGITLTLSSAFGMELPLGAAMTSMRSRMTPSATSGRATFGCLPLG